MANALMEFLIGEDEFEDKKVEISDVEDQMEDMRLEMEDDPDVIAEP